jgi:hypothetical protein
VQPRSSLAAPQGFDLKGKRGPAIVAARREVDTEMSEWLSSHLTPEQLGRLEQIDLQWEGASAMRSRPLLDESLNLTPDQQQKVDQCISATKMKRKQGSWTFEDHVSLSRQAIAILDERQRNLWIHLLGPPCPFMIATSAQPAKDESVAPASRIAPQPSH